MHPHNEHRLRVVWFPAKAFGQVQSKCQFKLANGEETTAMSDVTVIIGRMSPAGDQVTNKTSSVLVLFVFSMTLPHLMVA